MSRIVSLLPSATEIIAALGAQDQMVGRSHECDHPAEIAALPVCTAPRLDPNAESAEIDRAVKSALEQALAIYEVLEDRLKTLAPQIVVTQDQCEVCAVALADVEAVVSGWAGHTVRLVTLQAMDLAGIDRDIGQVGEALDMKRDAIHLIQSLVNRRAAIAARTAGLSKVTVACIEWTDPLMAAGNWVPELVALAGGRDVFGKPGAHAPWIDWRDLRAADPEAIVFMPCGFGLDRCGTEASEMTARQEWQDLQAVRSGRIYVTDGNSYFNRPGPRVAESLEILAEILHPEHFHFGHGVPDGGQGWQRLGS